MGLCELTFPSPGVGDANKSDFFLDNSSRGEKKTDPPPTLPPPHTPSTEPPPCYSQIFPSTSTHRSLPPPIMHFPIMNFPSQTCRKHFLPTPRPLSKDGEKSESDYQLPSSDTFTAASPLTWAEENLERCFRRPFISNPWGLNMDIDKQRVDYKSGFTCCPILRPNIACPPPCQSTHQINVSLHNPFLPPLLSPLVG